MKSNNLYIFRVNASPNIGFGHLIRCSALAEAIQENGGEVIFATNYPNEINKTMRHFKYKVLDLSSFPPFSQQELIFLLESLRNFSSPKVFIVDSYDVTPEYLKEIKKNFSNMLLVAIDDLGEKIYPVDILINGNLYAEKLDYSEQRKLGTKLLLGPKYLPLRKEFRNCYPHKIRDDVEDILVIFGGSDVTGLTEKVLYILVSMNLDKVKIHVVLGYGFERAIEREFKDNSNIYFYRNLNANEIKGLMEKADIAISAAGSTLYELATCGVPTIAIVTAENQNLLKEELERRGIVIGMKGCEELNNVLVDNIKLLLTNKEKRKSLTDKQIEISEENLFSIVGLFMEGVK